MIVRSVALRMARARCPGRIEFRGKMKPGRCVRNSGPGLVDEGGAGQSAGIAPAVDDGIAPVEPEGAFGQARARGGLEAFVF